MAARRVLSVCSRNRLRSPTAARVFGGWPGLERDWAGLAADAETVLSAQQLAWAELILVMEPSHRRRLFDRHGARLKGRRVVVPGIRDDYDFMQPERVALLLRRAGPLLR